MPVINVEDFSLLACLVFDVLTGVDRLHLVLSLGEALITQAVPCATLSVCTSSGVNACYSLVPCKSDKSHLPNSLCHLRSYTMDPLSIIASTVVLGGACVTVSKTLARIRSLKQAPTLILALNNEISDI